MASEPIRRPRGRPRKEKTLTLKRRRGAPRKVLTDDPDRYFLALLQANIDAAAPGGISERRVVDTFASLRYGALDPTTQNFALMEQGKPFRVHFDLSRHKTRGWVGANKSAAKGWLYQNAFRPFADDLRSKVRKIRSMPPTHPDRRWLAAMSIAWRICLRGDFRAKDCAEALAGAVGERAYFLSAMQPTLFRRFNELNASPADRIVTFNFLSIFLPTAALAIKRCSASSDQDGVSNGQHTGISQAD